MTGEQVIKYIKDRKLEGFPMCVSVIIPHEKPNRINEYKPEGFLTIKEATKYLSRATIYRRISSGQIEYIRINGHLYINKESMLQNDYRKGKTND